MAGRVLVAPGEWDEVATRAVGFAADLSPEYKEVTIVFKRLGGEWVPWTLVAESYALRSVGVKGRGLYTLQRLRRSRPTAVGSTAPSKVGEYTGTVVHVARDPNAPESRAYIERLARAGNLSLLAFTGVPGVPGWVVVNGDAAASAPYVQRVNDYRGVVRDANVRFTQSGVLQAVNRDTPAADLRAVSLADIASSELLTDYGPAYWRIAKDLGSQRNPLVVDSRAVPRPATRQLPSMLALGLRRLSVSSHETRHASLVSNKAFELHS